ncbi:MAG: carbon-nitrogen hydrolase family protein [Betaproteobacteria bacterium]
MDRSLIAGTQVTPPAQGDDVFQVAALQMVSSASVQDNLIQAGLLIAQAASLGARLVALPEYFAIMGLQDTDKVAVREKEGEGPIQAFLSATAKLHGIWIVGGSVPLMCKDPGRVRNSCLVFDHRGEQVARYDKIHLFGFHMGEEQYHEARTIEPGNQLVTLQTPFGCLGLSICYDLRFPELYRSMQGVDIILVPAAFTATTGRAHWETLLRARAIENLAYLIAPAQGGLHQNGRQTHGDSMVIDPWGVVVNRLATGQGVVMARIDLAHSRALRANLPALSHRILK